MRRHDLSDAQWELIADLMPRTGRHGGGRWRDHRQVVNGLLWTRCPGAQWRDLPEHYGPWQTVDERLTRWPREGLFDTILDRLRLKLNAKGPIDLDLWCIDNTSAGQPFRRRSPKKADPQEPDDHAPGLSRGGFGSKIHLVSDGAGLPLGLTLTPGQQHEMPAFEPTFMAVRLPSRRGRPRTRPKYLAGDTAYSDRPAFAYLRRRPIRPVIPPRTGGNMGKGCARSFDPDLDRRRNAIERCVGWLKGGRSIAPRHEKLAVNFSAMVKLAFMRQYLRTLRPSDRS
ncbi:IS5 family transposase [Microvirga yunnanensis]|uniref:IS5 family transposase n=1 Tax=Microvirga yunnanensis TaxID=2953740 RepID=UPI0021C9381C|nr:IS5 family transposase [Microvirga sp. HBU65207]